VYTVEVHQLSADSLPIIGIGHWTIGISRLSTSADYLF